MARRENDPDADYKRILEGRQKNIDRNAVRGDLKNVKKVNFQVKSNPADTLSELLPTMKERKNLAQNIGNIVKRTPSDTTGIDAAVRKKAMMPKSKFFNLNKKIEDAAEVVEDVAKVADQANDATAGSTKVVDSLDDAAKLVKNNKGFAKMLPMLGLASAGYTARNIGQKVDQGDYVGAGIDTVDALTDISPQIMLTKAAVRSALPTDMGNSELPENEMQKRQKFNLLRKRLEQQDSSDDMSFPQLGQSELTEEEKLKLKRTV